MFSGDKKCYISLKKDKHDNIRQSKTATFEKLFMCDILSCLVHFVCVHVCVVLTQVFDAQIIYEYFKSMNSQALYA